MSNKPRSHFSAAKKVEVLEKLMAPNAKITDICEEYSLSPSSVYQWQKDLFARAHEIFEKKRGPKPRDLNEEKIKTLEQRLAKRDEVIVSITQQHCDLKKSLGQI